MADEKRSSKRHGLTLGEIEKAQRLRADGQSPEEIDRLYPGWEEEARKVQRAFAQVRKAMGVTPDPTESMARVLEKLGTSQSSIGEAIRRASEAAAAVDWPRDIAIAPPRNPDEATYRVADEVRELQRITKAAEETANLRAATEKAALDQAAALVSGVGALQATVDKLHETTRQGIAAAEVRDAKATKRENVLVRLTLAISILTAVLAWPEVRQIWSDIEPWRVALGEWAANILRR